MNGVADVIVVGGGPCGSTAAASLAKHGAKVTVFEEHARIGTPSHCPGHLSIKGLKQLGLFPLPAKIVENTFCGATFYSPKGNAFSIRFSEPITCIVDRVLFDEHIAEIAKAAGATYELESRVDSLLIRDGFVRGVSIKRKDRIDKLSAEIVVDGEGISSRLLMQTGLQTLDRHALANGVEAEVENVKNLQSDMVEVFLGREYAPGFYAWLIPKNDEQAKIGLAAKMGNPRELLQKLMLKHPVASEKLRKARILRAAFHPIALGGLIPRAYSNGFLAVGDAASHVKPTTGGGIILGMTCAQIAAQVASKALQSNDLSTGLLSLYQKRCEQVIGFDMNVMLRIRRMLDAMSDSEIDGLISAGRTLGLDKTLLNMRDIDFQGRSLLHVLQSPRMLAFIGYLLFLHLTANP